MLKHLNIKNFALVEELDLDFSSGLNIITGETGAGKSIIVDALMQALGERASLSMIMDGSPKAVIEAVFEKSDIVSLNSILSDLNIDESDELILRRELSNRGNSRCFINDTPVQLTALSKIGDLLVDFHGQHEHQSLLQKNHHIEMLDKLALDDEIVQKYSVEFSSLKSTIRELEDLINLQKNTNDRIEEASNELNLLKKVNPLPGEIEKIENDLKIIDNNEIILKLTDEILFQLSDSDTSLINGANLLRKQIQNLSKIDPSFEIYAGEISSSIITLIEIQKFSESYRFSLDFSSERAEELRERYRLLNNLRKKYNSIENAITRQSELEKELSYIGDFELIKSKLTNEIISQKTAITQTVSEISKRRKQAAADMEKAVCRNLAELGIEHSSFMVNFSVNEKASCPVESLIIQIDNKFAELNENGAETLEFYLSANRGESLKPLSEVASGGEVSRIMLSIKNLIAEKDNINLMVFDEIDTGISGRIAQKVGLAMKKLSNSKQVIAITHLAQIASLADYNILVSKNEMQGKARINAKAISGDEKLMEIAKLISGEEISEASLQNVIELSKVRE